MQISQNCTKKELRKPLPIKPQPSPLQPNTVTFPTSKLCNSSLQNQQPIQLLCSYEGPRPARATCTSRSSATRCDLPDHDTARLKYPPQHQRFPETRRVLRTHRSVTLQPPRQPWQSQEQGRTGHLHVLVVLRTTCASPKQATSQKSHRQPITTTSRQFYLCLTTHVPIGNNCSDLRQRSTRSLKPPNNKARLDRRVHTCIYTDTHIYRVYFRQMHASSVFTACFLPFKEHSARFSYFPGSYRKAQHRCSACLINCTV